MVERLISEEVESEGVEKLELLQRGAPSQVQFPRSGYGSTQR